MSDTTVSDTHIRMNRATREWVIYAPSRRIRPQDLPRKVAKNWPRTLQTPPPNCPFCQLNEPVLLEIPDQSGGWLTRVVPNKFPALSRQLRPKRALSGIYLELPGYGYHDVVVESPDHFQSPATFPPEAMTAVIETYRLRYLELMEIKDNLFTIIFRNQGEKAGASLQHPHSQIISTPIVPRQYRWREDEAQRYYDEWGRCAYCDILEFEMDDRKRVVGENDCFLAFVPYAAEVPFEIWLMPKEHSSDFGSITAPEVAAFASLLHEVLSRLYYKLDNPDYNYAIMSAARYKNGEPQLHWYCQVRPRLTISAGFEMGSGISINPSLPEMDAAFLNEN